MIFEDDKEAAYLAACRHAAETLQAAGLGWHYDMIVRQLRPPLRPTIGGVPIELDPTMPDGTFKLVNKKRLR